MGGGGNDKIWGDSSKNILEGDAGNDYIYGDKGNDTIDGGKGVDVAAFSSNDNIIDLRKSGIQNTKDGNDKLISIENIYGGGGADQITGSRSSNELKGENGNDKLNGLQGDDTLFGGQGNDLLISGNGKDSLFGESGKDVFQISKGDGYATIMDFSDGQDKILLASGTDGLSLRSKGKNMQIFQYNDLIAEVIDSKGSLQLDGNYLV